MATRIATAGGGEMTVGGTLTRGFAAIGAAPVSFFGTSLALVALPYALTIAPMRAVIAHPFAPGINPLARAWPLLAGAGVMWWLLYLLAQAVLFSTTVALLDGRPAGLRDHALAGLRALPALFGLSILLSLAVWAGMILLFVPGVMLAMIWSVAAPALAVERRGVFAAFGRSSRLTRGARWRVFGLCFVVFAVYWLASATVGIGNVAVNGVAGGGGPPLVSTLLSIVVQTAFIAIWSAIQAALYLDLRDWKDGPEGDRLAEIFA